ncbi:hypothetical protein JOC85_001942 [Bacillus mesophilus]|uniref:Uncharacterized protein n=1 Tax=Bacillus mesophilus TaxID=1808955 RepID=A0A6M0Q4Z2_9BACI|nr:hypothetical protein [Bacillus mesophilus]MBM7661170.1 hypothetical protein [Bacillus mesophilus]NEY71303.1 hypothetical protein [Bacillus mesophilus]
MKKIFYFFVFILVLLTGCAFQGNEEIVWYETKEQAIDEGLQLEGITREEILSIEELDGETIVFYEYDKSLGVASITQSAQGYSWYRSRGYTDLEGVAPFSTAGFEYETKSGLNVPVLVGKAFDQSITKMKLIESNAEKELEVFDKSRLFFSILKLPFSSIEIKPVK